MPGVGGHRTRRLARESQGLIWPRPSRPAAAAGSVGRRLQSSEPGGIRRVLDQMTVEVRCPIVPPGRPPFAQLPLDRVDHSARLGPRRRILAGTPKGASGLHERANQFVPARGLKLRIAQAPEPAADDEVPAIRGVGVAARFRQILILPSPWRQLRMKSSTGGLKVAVDTRRDDAAPVGTVDSQAGEGGAAGRACRSGRCRGGSRRSGHSPSPPGQRGSGRHHPRPAAGRCPPPPAEHFVPKRCAPDKNTLPRGALACLHAIHTVCEGDVCAQASYPRPPGSLP